MPSSVPARLAAGEAAGRVPSRSSLAARSSPALPFALLSMFFLLLAVPSRASEAVSPAAPPDAVAEVPAADTGAILPPPGEPEIVPAWRALGSGLGGEARALAVFGDELVAGGDFTEAGGAPASRIARWNGVSWSAIGAGTNGPVHALAVWNGALVAGGDFTSAGSAAASRIARWSGASWQPVGGGANGPVFALAVWNGMLVAGGSFASIGSADASNIAAWNGSAWSPVGAGTDGPVLALAVWEGDLVAGGSFSSAGGGAAANVARWDGAEWSPLGAGMDGPVRALLPQGGRLLAGGDFLFAGGAPASRAASWNGSAWSPLGGGTNGPVRAAAPFDGMAAIGGDFDRVGAVPSDRIALRRGPLWQVFRFGPNEPVHALVEYRGGLVAAGSFTETAGVAARYIARYACDPPDVPSGVAASSNLCGRVRVSWNEVPFELGYRVFRNGAKIGDVAANATSFDDVASPPGGAAYAVLAYNGCGESALSASSSGSAQRPAPAPTDLAASAGMCAIVHLSWDASGGAVHYRVLRDGAPVAVVLPSSTVYDDAPPPGEHVYEVQAGNSCGWSTSAPASGSALSPPAAPAAFSASDTSCSAVRLDWSAVAAAAEYRLSRDGAPIAVLPAGVLSFVDAPGAGVHRYAIEAGGACGWSALRTDMGTALASPATPPSFAASDSSCGAVLLVWSGGAGAAGYRLTRDGAGIASLPPSAGAFLDTVPPGTYAYGLRAWNACGWSGEANQEATVLPPSPSPPSFFDAGNGLCLAVRLTWGASAGASGYEIRRDGSAIATVTAPAESFLDTTTAGSHRYTIRALGACGASDSLGATGSTLPPDPGPVERFEATDTLCALVRVTWAAPAAADSVRLFRGGEPLATLGAERTSFADSGATGGHLYSIEAGGFCGWSAAVSDSGAVLPSPPDDVAGLEASRGLCSVIRLKWDPAPRAERYFLHRDGARIATIAAPATSWEDSIVGTHSYGVAAGNRCGGIAGSIVIEAIGFAAGPPAPVTDLAASDTSCTTVHLAWKGSPGADSLHLYRDGIRIAALKPDEGSYSDRVGSGEHAYEIELVNACGRSERARAIGTVLPDSLAPPLLRRPAPGAVVHGPEPVVLAWERTEGAIGCRVRLEAPGGEGLPLVDTLLAGGPDSLLLPPLPPGDYEWRAASVSACGEGEFSASNYFIREGIGAFDVSLRSLSFGHDPLSGAVGGSPPDPEPDAVVVRNEGEIPFAWTIEASAPWILAVPDSGSLGAGESETLFVAVRANDLPSGAFDGRIYVRTDLASAPEDSVDVSLLVKQYALGDCNGSGDLDERDIAALADHLLDAPPLWAPVLRLGLADIDGDDAVLRADLGALPPLIGSALLADRPGAGEIPDDEAVLRIGASADSFLVSIEGTGSARALAAKLRLPESAASTPIRARPFDGSVQTALVRDGRDLILLAVFPEGSARVLDGGARFDLAVLTWDGDEEPEMDLDWGGVAPSGSERFPIARIDWYRLDGPVSRRFAFHPIRPNPFSTECLLAFELPSAAPVSLRVYDPSGRLVRTIVSAMHAPGFHTYAWDGRDDSGRRVGLGLYFVRLESPRGALVRRSVIVR